jgi:hypothetical protein
MSHQKTIGMLLGMTFLLTNAPLAHAFTGRHLISAAGAIRESVAAETGTISLSGMIDFNRTGGATAVDITIDLIDSGGDAINCVLSTPADVAYTLSKEGIGTLTLTQGASDVCSAGGMAADSIVFNFVVLTETGRISAKSINLHDNMGDVVDLTTASGSILVQ